MKITKLNNVYTVTRPDETIFEITEEDMINQYGNLDNFIKSMEREVVLETLDIDLFENLLAQLEYRNMVEG